VLTAGRIGLLVAGDLGVSMQLADPAVFGALTVTPFEQMRDLVAWSLSDEYGALRRALGLGTVERSLGDDEITVSRQYPQRQWR
jgi:hypothetical protein